MTPNAERPRWWLRRRRPMMGIDATPTPAFALVAVGALFGPAGLGIISLPALAHLDAVVTVALGALGVFVGLALRARDAPPDRAFAAAVGEASLTAAVIGGGLWLLLGAWRLPLRIDGGTFAMLAAIAVSASAGARVPASAELLVRRAARIADLDDVSLVAAGTLALAFASGPDAATRLLWAAAAAVAAAYGVTLLMTRAVERERGLYALGAMLLVSGVAASFRVSPLFCGFAAAVLWMRTSRETGRITFAVIERFQHPLIGLLLIAAGASIVWSLAIVWIGVALVLLRLAGKLVASLVVMPLAHVPSAVAANLLLPPGVIGIAIALNAGQLLPAGAGTLLGSVTMAVALSDFLALFLVLEPHEAHT